MVLGPRFELMASGTLELKDIGDSIGNYDLQLTSGADVTTCELPLFGVFCLRLACQPECLVEPVATGYLNLLDEEKVKPYWCVLKNLSLACWSSKEDMEVTEPLLQIPVTKNTQISDTDPSRSMGTDHTIHIMTKQHPRSLEYTLAAQSKDELNKWWDGLQQHLLDQALWKHACDYLMEIRSPSPRKKPAFLRKSSIYDDTPLSDKATQRPSSVVGELKKEDDQLSEMLHSELIPRPESWGISARLKGVRFWRGRTLTETCWWSPRACRRSDPWTPAQDWKNGTSVLEIIR